MTDNTLKARLERCKALQEPEQVVEVREGYVVECLGNYGLTNATISEALTLRTADEVLQELRDEISQRASETFPDWETLCGRILTALGLDFSQDDAKPIRDGQVLKSPEFVRLEALEDAANQLRIMGDVGGMEIVLALIDNPAPVQEEQSSPEPVECDDSDLSPASSDHDVIYVGKRAYVATDTDVNALQAKAWDEGYIASADDGCSWTAQTPNPYRKGDE